MYTVHIKKKKGEKKIHMAFLGNDTVRKRQHESI